MAQTNESGEGLIRGRVLDERGIPVVSASVLVLRMVTFRAMVLVPVKTDGTGHFSKEHLAFGPYQVRASKVEDGYPEMDFSFYNDAPLRVTLSAVQPVVDLTVTIGPKAGVIQGSVSDAVSGAQIRPNFRLWHIKDPGRLKLNRDIEMSTDPSFHVLIPSNSNIGLAITVPGYEPWYYPGSSDPSALRALVLTPGETRTIDIRLRPIQPER